MTEFKVGEKVLVKGTIARTYETFANVCMDGAGLNIPYDQLVKRKPKAVQYAFTRDDGIWDTTDEKYSTDEEFLRHWEPKKFKRLS